MTTIRITSFRIAVTAALAAATLLAGVPAQQYPAAHSHAAVVTAAAQPDGPVPCCW